MLRSRWLPWVVLPSIGLVTALVAILLVDSRNQAHELASKDIVVREWGGTFFQDVDGRYYIDLNDTQIDDAGMQRLVESLRLLPKTLYLELARTRITDQCMSDIVRIENLTLLDLSGTAVTDHGVAGLLESVQLGRLIVTGSSVSEEWIQDASARNPMTVIIGRQRWHGGEAFGRVQEGRAH